MAKNIDHLQHIKSSVVEEGSPKLPNPSVLVEGEIAVNYADGYETLSIKNSNSEIVPFSSDEYYTKKKLGSGFTGENSANTVTKVIEDNEHVISTALNDLNERKLDASAYTPTDLSNYYTKSETSGATEISTALGNKTNSSDFTTHTANTTIHLTSTEKDQLHTHSNKSALDSITGSVGTMTYEDASSYSSATEVNTALNGKQETLTAGTGIDITNNVISVAPDQTIDSGTSASTNAVATQAVYNTIKDTELVWTNAYNAMSGSIRTHTADTTIHLTSNEKEQLHTHSNKTVLDGISSTNVGNWDSAYGKTSGITATTAAINSLTGSVGTMAFQSTSSYSSATQVNTALGNKANTSDLSVYADSVKYDSTRHYVEFYHGTTAGTKVFEYDASPFIIDGMVQNVEIKDVTSGSSQVTCLVVSFNTDAGKQDINIPISQIFDASNYYTTAQTSGASEIATALSGKVDKTEYATFSAATNTSIDDLSGQTETIAAAFNDIDERISDINDQIGDIETLLAAI